jgi:hypothetical protein
MSTAQAPASELLTTVKSHQIQRGMLAEMRGDRGAAGRHFLAAAHLELVLASDYAESGQADLALRSRLSAASCFWRAGQSLRAKAILHDVMQEGSSQATAAGQVLAELEGEFPP